MKINRLNDALVKFIFANDDRKDVTLDLINSFFEFEGTECLVDFQRMDRELDREYEEDKQSFLDIYGQTANGTQVNVEIQMDTLEYMDKRSIYYWTRMYQHLLKGENYDKLHRTVAINILNFDLFTVEETSRYHNCFGIINRDVPGHYLS